MFQSALGAQSLLGRILGHTDGSSAPAGEVGEYISGTTPTNNVVLATNTAANVSPILALSAGDWDVSGDMNFTLGATTSFTILQGNIGLLGTAPAAGAVGAVQTPGQAQVVFQSATIFNTAGFALNLAANVTGGLVVMQFALPTQRIVVSPQGAPFFIVSVANAQFTVAACNAGGSLRARRIR